MKYGKLLIDTKKENTMEAKILLLEDDQAISNLLKRHLEKESLVVEQYFDGQKAIEHFDGSYDLAVLDVMVPNKDGFKVLEYIRKQSNIPILFLTAREAELDKLLAFSSGADDYITKPFSIVEVVYRIKAQLRRYLEYSTNREKNILKNGDLIVEVGAFKAFLDGEILELNVKEFQLLVFFMRNIGQVFSKKQLYENIWNEVYYGDDNTVMVHISRLREKLKDNPKSPKYIRTIKGLGYRMEAI